MFSRLLSNLSLLEVLELSFEHGAKPRLGGRVFMVRIADGAVLVVKQEADARQVLEVLSKCFGRFGLTLHLDTTRLEDFLIPPQRDPGGTQCVRSFDVLGFTHYLGCSRKKRWVECNAK